MRLRPNLCAGTRRHVLSGTMSHPARALSQRVGTSRQRSNMRPGSYRLKADGSMFRAGRVERRAVQDVVLGDLDASRPNALHRLQQDHRAGHDRRRAVGVQAGAPRAAASAAGAASIAQHALAGSSASAGSRATRVGVVGLEPLVDRGQRRRRARHRDRRRVTLRAHVAGTASLDDPARPRGAALQLLGGAAGPSCRWRSVWRTEPAWVETWKSGSSRRLPDHELGAAAADVDARAAAARPASRALVAPRKVSRASSSPVIVRASKPKRSRSGARARPRCRRRAPRS